MARRVVERIVDAHDDVQCALILHRGSDDHTLHAAVEICLKLFWPEELASAFENDIAAKICPGDEARRNLRTEAEILLPDCDPFFTVNLERGVPTAVDAVEFQEMGRRDGAALDLVQVHDLEAIGPARIVG